MQKKYVIATILTAVSLLFSACKTMPNPDRRVDVSQNTLDWQGTYVGMIPCVACTGAAVQLSLFRNSTYALKIDNLGKSLTTRGTFTWHTNGQTVTLSDTGGDIPTQYRVGEGVLTHIDSNGEVLTYVLKKTIIEPIEDKKWRLIELNGKAIQGTAQTHYMTLHSITHRLEAKAGCNMMGGAYVIKNQWQWSAPQLISTMMACDNMQVEMDFYRALSSADNFSISGRQLSLNKARMSALAKFEQVEP